MGKKGTKRKTRWRVLPIGGEDVCNGVCSNDDEVDGDRDSASPLNNSSTTSTSYSRTSGQQRMPRTKPNTASSRGGSYNYRHRSYYQQPHDTNQPLVTTQKKTFNEEEYTKITTPRQDVLFKKGYLGRKRPTPTTPAESTANVNVDVANGNLGVEGTVDHNGEEMENDQASSEMMSPVDEQSQYIYATNGYVDQTGGPPPGLYYINGSGYELYDPYSGNVTVVVGPAPHYGGPGGGPPVLAAVPCQPLPLQPLEWFNPAFLPYVTAPCHNGLASARDRRKRYSTDSQNCSPQSSESTEPPGSPQECDMEASQPGEPPGPTMYTQTPAYVYPGYMFGPPMYNVNGVTVQGAPTQPPSSDVTGSNKRRKKKRRRRRRRGGAEDGCSEESSSDEKEMEEPMSVTSQESSSQEVESDSKQSNTTTTLNNSSSSSPLSSCQTLTPTAAEQNTAFDYHSPSHVDSQAEKVGEPLTTKDAYSLHSNCNLKPLVIEEQQQSFKTEEVVVTDDSNKDLNSVQLLKDKNKGKPLDLHSNLCTATRNSLVETDVVCKDTQQLVYSSDIEDKSLKARLSDKRLEQLEPIDVVAVKVCNGTVAPSAANEDCIKPEDSSTGGKQKKSNKQANVKQKKNSKGKEDKQKKSTKPPATNSNSETSQKKANKRKDDKVSDSAQEKPVNGIPIDITSDSLLAQEVILEHYNSLTTSAKSKKPNAKTKENLTNMDGNENKSLPKAARLEEQKDNTNTAHENLIASEKCETPPPKLVQSPDASSQEASETSFAPSVSMNATELPIISLRPDVPRFEPKVQCEDSLPQQFKGNTEILDSITEALINDPALQSKKAETNVAVASVATASTQEVVPVPPPRYKKCSSLKDKPLEYTSTQISFLDQEINDAVDESSGDSTTSSTTHESEESVIELLSSTNTNPEEMVRHTVSSDEEDDIIFRGKQPPKKSEIVDVKSIPPDKYNSPSISGPSLTDSSQLLEEGMLPAFNFSPSLNSQKTLSLDFVSKSAARAEQINTYANEMSKAIVSEAALEASKKRLTMPITEAVARWLRSQSPEILSLPPPEDETESDISSEDQGEKATEADANNKDLTGQKNLLCNPLPVPSLEDCHHMSVNSEVNRCGCSGGTGRRVASNQKTITYGNDNNNIIASKPGEDGDERLKFQSECRLEDDVISASGAVAHYIQMKKEHDCSTRKDIPKNAVRETELVTESVITGLVCDNKMSKLEISGNNNNNNSGTIEEDEFSLTSDETLECEWDSWDCNPIILPVPVTTPMINIIPTPDEMLTKTPEDHCSQMCDPTVSVAKYYSLGAQQPRKKSVKFEDEETDSNSVTSSEEEVDALKHFQYELEDDDGLRTNSQMSDLQTEKAKEAKPNYGNQEIDKSVESEANARVLNHEGAYNSTFSHGAQASHIFSRKSSILVSRLKGDGPFPCGGICCIIQ